MGKVITRNLLVWTAAAAVPLGALAAVKAPKSVRVPMETIAGRYGGHVTLIQEAHDVKVEVALENLDPGEHAMHIHQYPKCDAPDFKSAGGHFNPSGKQHGYQNPQGHHAGDMPINLKVTDAGKATKTFTTKDITLDPNAPNSVFANGGTSIIVHNGPDDMKTDPSGNAGGREACGVITLNNGSKKKIGKKSAGEPEPASNN